MEKQEKAYTIGHSRVDIQTFIGLLKTVDIETVIDCRSRPRSRWWWFNEARLSQYLADANIQYEWRGSSIGGYGRGEDYDEVLDELAERISDGEKLALTCSEGLPQNCHRGTELAPELEARGVEVEHLIYGVQR